MEKHLWKFYWDCGRSGSISGLFVATEEEVKSAIGKEAYFGEVLGKHSEVYGELEEENIKKLDVSSQAVEEVSKHLGFSWSGFNPLDYVNVNCKKCEFEDRADEMYYIDNEPYCWTCKEELKQIK